MFRVIGRDARGGCHEVSVSAATEEEARALVLGSGDLSTIDRVTHPQPATASRSFEWSGWTVTIFGCLLCLGCVTLGAVIGGCAGHLLDEDTSELLRFRWFFGGVFGAVVGLICGVGLLVAFVKRFWRPR